MLLPGAGLNLLVRKLASRAPLDQGEQHAIASLPFTVRTFEPGGYLVRDGEVPKVCGVLLEGYAFRQKLNLDGARQIVSINIPGEALDFQHIELECADHNVQALTRVVAAIISRDAIKELMERLPAVAKAILMDVLVDASIFREWIANVGRRDARARVSHLLCEFAARLDAQGLTDGFSYELPMTQEQLGDAVGLTSVHVNRTLRALAADGLISRSKRFVTFTDARSLRAAAGFNSRYLHLAKPLPN